MSLDGFGLRAFMYFHFGGVLSPWATTIRAKHVFAGATSKFLAMDSDGLQKGSKSHYRTST